MQNFQQFNSNVSKSKLDKVIVFPADDDNADVAMSGLQITSLWQNEIS